MNTSRFTSLNSLFLGNPEISFWRFEVVYTFPTEKSTSSLNFIINQPPQNGSCSINPLNGTTSTVFTINCTDWLDDDGIKDYSFFSKIIFFFTKDRNYFCLTQVRRQNHPNK
jgi:hypothetical protein